MGAFKSLATEIQGLITQYGADTVAAAVALLVPTHQTCKRCGHTWKPRTAGTPRQCPACHVRGWQTERRTRTAGGEV